MRSKIKQFFSSLLVVDPQERTKLLFLTLSYFFIIAGYSVVKELKDSIFTAVVGTYYVPRARIFTWIALIPPLLLYAKMVDSMRRYQLLCVCCFAYGIIAILCAFLIGHPTIGIANTDPSPYRLFGWFFYFFVEAYTPFVVSVFWAFANSISDQNAAKKNYGLMVSGSKVGGMVGTGIAMLILYLQINHATGPARLTDITNHQILLGVTALATMLVPLMIWLLMKFVPGRYLHGYEAAYQVEKEHAQKGESKTGIFSGILMLLKYPYVLGIFGFIFSYEVINTVLSYQRVQIAVSTTKSVSEMSFFLYKIVFFVHFIGFFISLFGTRALLRTFGERRCLILIPVINALLLAYFMFSYTPFAMLATSVLIKTINYALSYPLRESLYIPTIKEIKFKSKSWIDTFGAKFAKSFGSLFNETINHLSQAVFHNAYSLFFAGISLFWITIAALLGKRYEEVVAKNEVIGAQEFVQSESSK